MNILYCGLKYDYGKQDQGVSFEYQNFYLTLKNMISINKLDCLDIDNANKEVLNDNLLKKCKLNSYDLIFFFMFKDEFYPETLNYIKNELSIPTIAWMADDHWRFEIYSKYIARNFSLVVTTDRDSVQKYKKNGLTNVFLSQWACNHFIYKPQANKLKKHDVTFVGMKYGNRKKKIDKIKKIHEIECWGKGWKNSKLLFSDMLDVYSNSLISLNFSESSYQKNFKTLIKIFFSKNLNNKIEINNPKLISANLKNFFQKTKYQIKGRVFEVPGCKGFLLTEKCPYLDQYLRIDSEIVTFESLDEAIEKIKFYKKNINEIKRIKERGYLKVLNEHTYEKRLLEIFNKLL